MFCFYYVKKPTCWIERALCSMCLDNKNISFILWASLFIFFPGLVWNLEIKVAVSPSPNKIHLLATTSTCNTKHSRLVRQWCLAISGDIFWYRAASELWLKTGRQNYVFSLNFIHTHFRTQVVFIFHTRTGQLLFLFLIFSSGWANGFVWISEHIRANISSKIWK